MEALGLQKPVMIHPQEKPLRRPERGSCQQLRLEVGVEQVEPRCRASRRGRREGGIAADILKAKLLALNIPDCAPVRALDLGHLEVTDPTS